VHTAFNFRHIDDEIVLRAYSSLKFGGSPDKISTYNNNLAHSSDRKSLLYDADFVYDKQVYHFQIKLKMLTKYDLLLGMEFKKADCIITGSQLPLPISTELKQSIMARIRNLGSMHLSSNSGWKGRWGEKLTILDKITINKQ
jgi:hypothetical protein